MQQLQCIVLGFLPGLFWLWFLRRRDDHEPEPLRLVILLFGLGIGSAFAVLSLRPSYAEMLPGPTSAYWHSVDAFLLTAPIEEVLKTLAFVIGIYWHRELDEPLDGIIYGTAVGLGFASAENSLYVLREMQLDHELSGLWLLRGFTSTLIHVGTTGLVGFFLGLSRMPRGRRTVFLGGLGLSIAIAFHGAYNYFLSKQIIWVPLLVVLPVLLVLLTVKIRSARAVSEEFHR